LVRSSLPGGTRIAPALEKEETNAEQEY
jgi:hypothetical protein